MIRDLSFEEVGCKNSEFNTICIDTGTKIMELLDSQDKNGVKHQAMILTHTMEEAISVAELLNIKFYTRVAGAYCRPQPSKQVLGAFESSKFRIIVVYGKLLVGFNRPQISVVGILRNIQPESRTLFTQIVEKCLHKISADGSSSIG